MSGRWEVKLRADVLRGCALVTGSPEGRRPELAGVYVEPGDGQVTCVGTDARLLLAARVMAPEARAAEPVTLPVDVVWAALETEPLYVTLVVAEPEGEAGRMVGLRCEERLYGARELKGFPRDWRRAVPSGPLVPKLARVNYSMLGVLSRAVELLGAGPAACLYGPPPERYSPLVLRTERSALCELVAVVAPMMKWHHEARECVVPEWAKGEFTEGKLANVPEEEAP